MLKQAEVVLRWRGVTGDVGQSSDAIAGDVLRPCELDRIVRRQTAGPLTTAEMTGEGTAGWRRGKGTGPSKASREQRNTHSARHAPKQGRLISLCVPLIAAVSPAWRSAGSPRMGESDGQAAGMAPS